MRVVLTGASGFIGSALVPALEANGHDVVPVSRSERPGYALWNPSGRTISVDGQVDAVVHLAGETIGGRWTTAKKQRLVDSRVDGTATMAQFAIDKGVGRFVSGSAIGFYGSRGDEILTEDKPAGSGFLADLTHQWEKAAGDAIDAGISTAFVRTALVLDKSGGSFPRMLLPFKFGAGGSIGTGDQWWSWITLRDQVRAMIHVLENDIAGPINLSSPNPVPNRGFVSALGRAMSRPAILPAPAFALKAILGGEFAEQVLLASQRVVPTVLEQSGFEFVDGELDSALDAVVGAQ